MHIYARTASRFSAALIVALCSLGMTARAQVTGVPLFFTNSYQQTGPGTTTYNGSSFDARIFETNPGDVVTATLTYPGPGSPGTFTQASYSTTILEYGLNEPTMTALQTAFPFGTYTVNGSGGTSGPGSVNVDYTQNAFASNVPELTPLSYNALQGLDSSQSFTFNFNADAPVPASNDNLVFVNIFDATTGAPAFGDNFQPSTTTSEFLPANTLAPNTSYNLQVVFSNRISSSSGSIDTTLGFDQATITAFTTAPVPEVSSVVSLGLLLALGLGTAGVSTRRRKIQTAH